MEGVIQRAFAGGELAPALHARADVAKYTLGLKTCRNFFVRREGGVSNRAGFAFVDGAKTDNAGTRLIAFIPPTGNGILIEMGEAYFRFFRAGAPVLLTGVAAYSGATPYVPGDIVASGGVNYYCIAATTGNAPPNVTFWYAMPADGRLEVPSPYSLSALPKWNQSGNVITLTHTTQVPRELTYQTLTRWTLTSVVTVPSIAAPTGGAGLAGAVATLDYSYVVTAAKVDTFEESAASAPIAVANCDVPTPATPNTLSWTAQPTAGEFYVYCDPYGNGVYGYIGTATTNAFADTGFVPDFGVTPPDQRSLFAIAANFPDCSATHQQRRFFANTVNEPDSVWGSRTGFRSNFGISSPLQDDDSLTFRTEGNNNNPVHWMVSMRAGLVMLTGGGGWTVGAPKEALTPSNLPVDQETFVGIDPAVRPIQIGNSIVYVQQRGTTLRDLGFAQQVEGLAGKDLSVFSSHLLARGKTARAIAFQMVPHSIVWVVRSDGTLLGMTYLPDQDVWGWHRHDTEGAFEDIAAIPEDDEDVLYALVSRDIDGATVRYIERMESREIREGFFNADSFFVDSGLSYAGPAANVFSGLDHLEGRVVAVLGDGAVLYDGDPEGDNAAQFTVVGGAIDVGDGAGYANVHIGLRIPVVEIETLDLDVQGSSVRDKHKRVGAVSLLLDDSSRGFTAGPDSASLRAFARQEWESAENRDTGQFSVNLTSAFSDYGRVIVRQVGPLPLTILGIIPSVELGG